MTRRIWQRAKLGLAAALMGITLTVLGGTVHQDTQVQALSNTLLDDSEPIYLGVGWHTSFDGYSISLAAYYDNWNDSRTINIFGGSQGIFNGAGCRSWEAMQSAGVYPSGLGPESYYATVRLSVTGGGSVLYRIKVKDFCNGSSTWDNLRTSPDSARFIGRYQLPLGSASRDSETNKYKVTVNITLTPAMRSLLHGNYNPNAFFRVRANGGLVGTLSGQPIGTRVYSNSADFYTHRLEFGAPCSMNTETIKTVGVYDPDNYGPNGEQTTTQGYMSPTGYLPFVFYVEERLAGSPNFQPLAQSRYSIQSSTGSLQNDGTRWVIRSTTRQDAPGGVSPSTLVNIAMQPDASYRFVARYVHTNNFLQVILPTDAIYNEVNCDRGTELQPGSSLAPSIVTVGNQITASSWIDNNGSVNSGEVNWQRRVWLDAQGNSSYDGGIDDQSIEFTTGNATVDPDDSHPLNDVTRTITDSSKSQVCVGLWLTGIGSTTVENSPSISCSPIGRYPQTQISGADVIANGQVSTAVHQIQSRNYGSWIEYSVFAASNVNSISGGSLPAGGYNSIGQNVALTYANRPPSPPGNFAPDLADYSGNLGLNNGVWEDWTENNGIDETLNHINDINPGQVNQRNGNIDITGSSWSNINDSYVIYATGNVNIRAPLEYTSGPFDSLNDLPQLVIIADGYIRIDQSVDRVDAWLISNSRVLTCARATHAGGPLQNYYSFLDANTCNDQLRINGPIQADSLYLRRTGGAGADGSDAAARSTPAEVINLRSDAYLWAYGRASQGQSIRTDSVKELPPRF